MKDEDVEPGREYQTRVGLFWKTVRVAGEDPGQGDERVYLVVSPAGNLLRRTAGRLRVPKKVTRRGLTPRPLR